MIANAIEKSIRHAINFAGTLSRMDKKRDGRASRRVPDPKTWGGRVQLLREKRGWSQGQLAKVARMAQPTIANIESGHTAEGLSLTNSKLAKALGVSAVWLMTGEGSPLPEVGASSPEGEAVAIFRQLSPEAREFWMDAGRALVARQAKKP